MDGQFARSFLLEALPDSESPALKSCLSDANSKLLRVVEKFQLDDDKTQGLEALGARLAMSNQPPQVPPTMSS